LSSLPENFAAAVGTYPAGTLLDPVAAEEGVHIVKIAERRDDRPYDLELDRKELTEMARREKTSRKVDEWVAQLRKDYYVDVRL
jgi:parvulin-like peptidyl-prolyl isomerase